MTEHEQARIVRTVVEAVVEAIGDDVEQRAAQVTRGMVAAMGSGAVRYEDWVNIKNLESVPELVAEMVEDAEDREAAARFAAGVERGRVERETREADERRQAEAAERRVAVPDYDGSGNYLGWHWSRESQVRRPLREWQALPDLPNVDLDMARHEARHAIMATALGAEVEEVRLLTEASQHGGQRGGATFSEPLGDMQKEACVFLAGGDPRDVEMARRICGDTARAWFKYGQPIQVQPWFRPAVEKLARRLVYKGNMSGEQVLATLKEVRR